MSHLLYALLIIPILIGISVIRAMTGKKTLPLGADFDGYSEEDVAYAEKLSEMIRYKTIAIDAGGEEAQFDAYRAKLDTLFPLFFSRVAEIDIDGAYLWKIGGTSCEKPALVLAHSDVVDADGQWEHPPFSGVIQDGMIYGRGVLDNKGMLCTLLSALERLLGEGFTPKQDLYIASTHNEESSSGGAIRCREYFEGEGITLASVLDEGGMITCGIMPGIQHDVAMAGLCEKGYIDLRFIAKSSGGHSGSPSKGNPLARLAALINHVETRRVFKTKLSPTVRGMFHAVAPYMGFSYRLLLSNFWLYGGLLKITLPRISPDMGAMLRTTIVFTRCEGSGANNVIPTMASAIANIRTLPGESCEEVISKLSRLAKKYDIETVVLSQKEASSETSIKSEVVTAIFDTIRQVFPGTVVSPYMTIGATDCCRLDGLSDHIIRFSPLRATGEELEAVHGNNERLGIAALGRGVAFFYQYFKQMEESTCN